MVPTGYNGIGHRERPEVREYRKRTRTYWSVRRRIWELYHLGVRGKEIAERLGVSYPYVRMVISRGKRASRRIKEYFDGKAQE